MAVKESKGLKVNYLIIFLSGLVLLISGILVFLLIVRNIYGNYELKEILPTKENLKALSLDKEKKAAILYSQYTQNMLPEGSTWLQDNVDTWEKFIKGAKMNYDVISDQDIELGKHFPYKLIILPGSKALSDKELLELKKYLENGGSIFSTGGPATFSDEGKWRGWDFFTQVFGMKFTKEVKPEEFYKVHTLRGNLPLTAGIPTGYALKIATWDRPIYAEILEPRTTQVSFWYDFRHEAGLVREEINKSAGIAFGSYGKGRFVWYGFELNSVLGQQEDYIYFERLFNNSVNWLTYNATAYVKDWPAPYDAAAVILPTLDQNIYNINNLTPILNSLRAKATFFVDPFTASKHQSLMRSLAKYGDFGTITDIGFLQSINDTTNALYDKQTQFNNLAFAKDTLGKITKTDVRSLMPLYGFFNDYTMQDLAQLDYDFIVTDSLTDRSVPKVEIRDGKPLMIITKTARDDYEVIKGYGLKDQDFQLYTYEEDVDRVLFEGGLYVFKLHTNYQLRPEYVNVVSNVLKYARKKNMWITSLPDIWRWWLRRQGVEVRYEARSKRRIAVEVTNPTNNISRNLVVEVHLNKKVKNVQISSDIINTKMPRYDMNNDTETLYMYFDELDAHESRSYLVDYDNISS